MSMDLLQEKIRKKKNPVLLSLDIGPDQVPPSMAAEDRAASVRQYGTAVLETLADLIPAVELDPAWFLPMGAAGLETMAELLSRAEKLGYYRIVRTMRSDLEEEAAQQGALWFGPDSPFQPDALCIGAFAGSDGVRPYLPYCADGGKGLFVLARTANKSAREVQDLLSGDRVVHTVMLDLAMRWSAGLLGRFGYSQVGAVLGIPRGTALRELRERYDHLFYLVQGYGTPGLLAKDVQFAFDRFGHGAIVEAPGSLLSAWQREDAGDDPLAEVRAAAEKLRRDLAAHVTVI